MHQRISKRAHHFGHLISKEANQAVSSGKELLITNRRVGLVINLIDGLSCPHSDDSLFCCNAATTWCFPAYLFGT